MGQRTSPHGEEFVIERVSEMDREFWTGEDWSHDQADALWYSYRPIAPLVTMCETAQVMDYPGGKFDD
jgi:putative alpha-1,2-mannosidase